MIPDIQIQCEEQTQTRRGKWKRCTQDATTMVTLQHFGDHCERHVIALCNWHQKVVTHNLGVIQQQLQQQVTAHGHSIPCDHCGQPLTNPEDVGQVTRL